VLPKQSESVKRFIDQEKRAETRVIEGRLASKPKDAPAPTALMAGLFTYMVIMVFRIFGALPYRHIDYYDWVTLGMVLTVGGTVYGFLRYTENKWHNAVFEERQKIEEEDR